MKVKQVRLIAIYGFFLLLAMVIIVRIISLQFIKPPEKMGIIRKTERYDVLECTRGSIIADDGRYLAFSIPEYRLGMDCQQPADTLFNNHIDELAKELSQFYGDKRPSEYKKMIVERRHSAKSRYLVINRRLLTYNEMKEVSSFAILKEGRLKGGLSFEKIDHRTYPYGKLGYRTLGYIKSQDERPVIGLEGSQDSILRGTPGRQPMRLTEGKRWIVDNERETVLPIDGTDVHTTINIDFQDIAHNALEKVLEKSNEIHAGTVILMEVSTGEIKAMVNLEKRGRGDYEETYNYAIGRKGEPGSVFKAATLTTLIEDGKIKLSTNVPGTVTWQYGKGKPFIDHYLDKYQTLTVKRGFEISSNNVFRMLAANHYGKEPQEFLDKLTNERMITKDFPFELNGFAHANLKRVDDKSWNMKDLPQIAMGYTVEVTPLHTLNYYNAIANGGTMVRPHLVRSYVKGGIVEKEFPVEVLGHIASPSTVQEVQKAMRGVVENEGGTGYHVFKGCPVAIAGKTGTARIVFPQTGKYEDRSGRKMHQATFVGFFPYEAPKYSMIVVVYSEPTNANFYGATWGGPVFREIAEKLYASSSDWIPSIPSKGKLPVTEDYRELDRECDAESGNIPDVLKLGLKDALKVLENSGYKVTFEGCGKVSSVEVLKRDTTGRRVKLILKNIENEAG